MLINLRNALMAGKRLPYDAEVEWLGSTGTQFILTNLVLDSYDYSFEYGGKKCEWGWIHNNVASGTWLAAQFTERVAYQFYKTFEPKYAKTKLSPSTRYDYRYGTNGFWIAGSYMGMTNVSIGSDPITTGLPLFANYDFYNNRYQARGTPNLPCTFEYFRAYKQDELILDLIPVRKGTVGYLYDRVSGKLFGNAGTGSFAIGPDIPSSL